MKLFFLLRRKRFYIFLILVCLVVPLYDFLELRYTDSGWVSTLTSTYPELPVAVGYAQGPDRPIRYVEIGHPEKPLLVFVHGSPSSSSIWAGLIKDSTLLKHTRIRAVDRAGYGYSGLGNIVTSVKEQAAGLAAVLQQKRALHEKIIVLGSSYGGTVAARLAMDFPKLLDGLILMSASVEPGKETTYWVTYPTSQSTLSWLVPRSLRVANAEKLSHKYELEKMKPHWPNIIAPTVIMHGDADQLIWPSNARYSEQQLVNAASVEVMMQPTLGHNFIWQGRQYIKQAILKLVQQPAPGKELPTN